MGEIDLPVVEQGVCQDKLRTTRLGQKFKLHDSFLCAGGINGKDTCKGDGGSPLVCPSTVDPETYIQAGIVAWGIGCGEDGTPGVYADVSQASCWIDQAVSCHYGGLVTEPSGNFPSYFGYTSDQCQVWLETKVQDLENKRDGAGKFGRIFQAMIDKYTSCHGFGVGWEEPNAPIIDPAPPRTVTDNGDDSYNTNDKIVDVDDSYNTNDKLVDAGDSYNTNGKIVDQSTPVTCASPPAAKVSETTTENYVDAFDLREEDKAAEQTGQY